MHVFKGNRMSNYKSVLLQQRDIFVFQNVLLQKYILVALTCTLIWNMALPCHRQ